MKKLYFSKRIPNIGKLGSSIKNNSTTILMLSMFACGLIAGACTVISGKFNDNYFFSNTIKETVASMISSNKNELFKETLISSTVFTFSTLPLALCCIGLPIICIIPVLRGIGYGAVGAYLISNYSMNGLSLYCLSVVPGAVISVFALIAACGSAVTMSKSLFLSITGKNNTDKLSIKKYLISLIVFLLISTGGCIVNLITSAFFKDLFVLV